jgi:uncharacterized protein (DUF427 family)
MAKAVLNGVTVAQSDDVRVVEGMVYFPVKSVDMSRLTRSETTTRCFWKGKASYWHVTGDSGDVAADAAFTYERPWPLAKALVSDRVAFWRDVVVKS